MVFGSIILNSFQFRWTSSCIANPEYEPEDMIKAILYALTSYESSETPFLVVRIFPVWDDTPWNSAFIRGHSDMFTLIRIPAGHMRFVPAHRKSDDMTAILSSAKWLVEFVFISNATSREKYLDRSWIHGILALAIQDVCHMTMAHTKLFPLTDTTSTGALTHLGHHLTSSIPKCRASLPTTRLLAQITPPMGHNTSSISNYVPNLGQVRSHHLPRDPLRIVELSGGLATGLAALLRSRYAIISYV